MARAFAREGAKVFLAGRTLATLDKVAEDIRSAGGVSEPARVDALDEQAVDRYVDAVAEKAGGIDISFNLISYGDIQGTPLAEMPLEDFEQPVMTAVRTQFLTSRATARHMIGQGSGVILFFGGDGDLLPNYYLGGFQVGSDAYAEADQPIERPGRSCFLRDGESIFHTYSIYARGLETAGGSYYFLDETALGRQEDWEEPRGRATDVRGASPDFSS